MLSILLVLALGGGPSTRSTGPGKAITFPTAPNPSFQFFPASGTGAGTECAGTVPTGRKGETISFSRAGGQTCTRANGNVVKLTANQPVVESLTGMAMSDGNLATTGAQLGMLDEAAVTNVTLQSEALDNAAWSSNNSVVGNPTVTANFAAAPDGAITAERLQYPATSGTQFSERFQTNGCPASGTVTISLYGKANTGTAVVDVVTSGGTATSCTFTTAQWTRCVVPNFTSTTFVELGHMSNVTGQARAADDVLLWGVQCELGNWSSSYIPTTTVAVARSATSWTVDTTTFTPAVTSASGCFGADAYFPINELDAALAYGCGFSGGGSGSRVPYEGHIGVNDNELRLYDGANQNTNTGLSVAAYRGTLQSVSAWWKTGGPINSFGGAWGRGTDQNTFNNSVVGAGGTGGAYTLGHTAASCGLNPNAWLTRIRMDTDSTGGKCR